MKSFVMQKVNELVKSGLTMEQALTQLFKAYIAKFEASNDNATKSEINQITDCIFELKHPRTTG